MDKLQHTFLRYAQITLGCVLYGLGFCWFYAPNQLCMGGFTHQAHKVILCTFAKNQIIDLKKRVQQVDPDAFIIVYDANEVLGKGFGAYQPSSV